MDLIASKDSATQSTALDSFHPFSELSPELRLNIWQMALDAATPNVVTVRTKWMFRARARYQIPPLLHTNNESRHEALKKYKPSFARQLGKRPVYFDCEQDILYMETSQAFRDFYGQPNLDPQFELDIRGLRHLAIGGDYDFGFISWRFFALYGLYSIEVVVEAGLEDPAISPEVQILFDNMDDEWWEHIEHYKQQGLVIVPIVDRNDNDEELRLRLADRAKGSEIWKDGEWRKASCQASSEKVPLAAPK